MAKRPAIGDIFQIPLSNGMNAYGQYLHKGKMGPIIRVYSLISDKVDDLDRVVLSEFMFPPVITGLYAAIKLGMWSIVGNRPIFNFVHPKFVSTLYDQVTGKARIWFLWDGQKTRKIGNTLPNEYKELEFLVIWDPQSVVERIETGKIPFPYGELIRNNEFVPRKR